MGVFVRMTGDILKGPGFWRERMSRKPISRSTVDHSKLIGSRDLNRPRQLTALPKVTHQQVSEDKSAECDAAFNIYYDLISIQAHRIHRRLRAHGLDAQDFTSDAAMEARRTIYRIWLSRGRTLEGLSQKDVNAIALGVSRLHIRNAIIDCFRKADRRRIPQWLYEFELAHPTIVLHPGMGISTIERILDLLEQFAGQEEEEKLLKAIIAAGDVEVDALAKDLGATTTKIYTLFEKVRAKARAESSD
jgi:hypothetical protein